MNAEQQKNTAFPYGDSDTFGLSKLEYFAAHAPVKPQEWFIPDMPPRPKSPAFIQIQTNDGEKLTEDEAKAISDWQRDPIWDLESNFPRLSNFAEAFRKFWKENNEWEVERIRQKFLQWPWTWAKSVLEAKPL